ncbi:MAG: serine/threonine-protein kinase [Kofleriaceae bacterium]
MTSESDDRTRGTRADPGAATADGQAFSPTGVATSGPTHHAGPTIIPSWGPSVYASLPEPGYQIGELIGRGGMGEVVVAQDQRIGREVAVKRIRAKAPSQDAVERFLREARIQARLDHPAIVPVYELGTDAEGLPYFTMKRLAGETLHKRLADKAQVRPLLRAFVDVCLAIQLAHTRGVVHRDLKPSNIMLGDYGEVYVLDWGVARVISDRSRSTHPMQAVGEHDADEGGTTAGAILGTPGYMAPEQVKGVEVSTAADIYALGAILFEILVGEALHPRGEAALGTTLTQPQEAPTQRARDRAIAPELDLVCFDALAEDPEQRPTARELADRIQAYLDGDRDLERRRVLAAGQLESARDALLAGDNTAHATAMRRAGRALALDPDNEDAAALVGQLMLEPPADPPKELLAAIDKDARAGNRARSRKALVSYTGLFVLSVVMLPVLDVKDWTLQLGFLGVVAILAGLAFRGMVTARSRLKAMFAINLFGIVLFSRMLGPFMLTPILTLGVLLSFSSSPRLLARPYLIWMWLLLAIGIPIAAEVSGLFPRTFELDHGAVVTTSQFYVLHGVVSEIVLIFGNLVFMVIAVRFMISLSRSRNAAHQKLLAQAWHLEQMLPANRPWQTKPPTKPSTKY